MCCALGLSSLGQTEAKQLASVSRWALAAQTPFAQTERSSKRWKIWPGNFFAHIYGKELVVKGYRIRELSGRAAPGGSPALNLQQETGSRINE